MGEEKQPHQSSQTATVSTAEFGHIMAGARGGEVDGNGSVIVGVCGGVREGAGLKPHMRIGRWLCL